MMTDATMTAESTAADPLRTAADAMALAVQAARDGASDAQATVSNAMPAMGRFFSRFTYTTFYTISYGIVFPSLLVARAVPRENAIVHGLIDGGMAARDAVAGMGKNQESLGADAAERAGLETGGGESEGQAGPGTGGVGSEAVVEGQPA